MVVEGGEEFWLPVRGYGFEYREGLLLYRVEVRISYPCVISSFNMV